MTNGQSAPFRTTGKEPTRPGYQSNPSGDERETDGRAAGTPPTAATRLSDAAQQAGSQVKETAASLATEAGARAKGLLNQQVGAAADIIIQIAESVRAAAKSLDPKAPALAGLANGAADRVEEFSDSVRDQTVEELLQTASDFVRRRPAVVFGAAAAFGFLLFRVLKVETSSRGGQTMRSASFRDDSWRRQSRGDEWSRTGPGSAAASAPRGSDSMHRSSPSISPARPLHPGDSHGA